MRLKSEGSSDDGHHCGNWLCSSSTTQSVNLEMFLWIPGGASSQKLVWTGLMGQANWTEVFQNEHKTHFLLSFRYSNKEGEASSVQGGAEASNKTPTTLFTFRGMWVDRKTWPPASSSEPQSSLLPAEACVSSRAPLCLWAPQPCQQLTQSSSWQYFLVKLLC